jgi:hypothetical protein
MTDGGAGLPLFLYLFEKNVNCVVVDLQLCRNLVAKHLVGYQKS